MHNAIMPAEQRGREKWERAERREQKGQTEKRCGENEYTKPTFLM